MFHARQRPLTAVLLLLVIGSRVGAQTIDVSISPPGIELSGTLAPYQDELDLVLDPANASGSVAQLEDLLNADEDLVALVSLPRFTQAAAQAGGAVSLTMRRDLFGNQGSWSVNAGAGASITAPGVNPGALQSAAEQIEQEGDIYVGAALVPVSGTFSLDLSQWSPGTRAELGFGISNIQEGDATGGFRFSSFTFGAGVSHAVVAGGPRRGELIEWHGVRLGSGVFVKAGSVEVALSAQENPFEQPITYGDINVDAADLTALGRTASDVFVELSMAPAVNISIETMTVTVPLDVITSVRALWVLDLMLGVSADLTMGTSVVEVGGDLTLGVNLDDAADPFVSITPGSVGLGILNVSRPQLVRPRITTGVAVNLGPVGVQLPVAFHFERDGVTVTAGVSLGWTAFGE